MTCGKKMVSLDETYKLMYDFQRQVADPPVKIPSTVVKSTSMSHSHTPIDVSAINPAFNSNPNVLQVPPLACSSCPPGKLHCPTRALLFSITIELTITRTSPLFLLPPIPYLALFPSTKYCYPELSTSY
jgi:hypothetical protein